MIEVVPATLAHAEALAPRMGAADAAEIWAATFSYPIDSLTLGVEVSRDPKAALVDGEVLCMFGCAPPSPLGRTATPWLLGSVDLPKHARGFLRGSRLYFSRWRQEYEILANYVDARHSHAIRWLAWLGFSIEPARPYGVARLPFHRFSVIR